MSYKPKNPLRKWQQRRRLDGLVKYRPPLFQLHCMSWTGMIRPWINQTSYGRKKKLFYNPTISDCDDCTWNDRCSLPNLYWMKRNSIVPSVEWLEHLKNGVGNKKNHEINQRVEFDILRVWCYWAIFAAVTANTASRGSKWRYDATAATGTTAVQVVGTMAWSGCSCRHYVPIDCRTNILSRAGLFQDALQFRLERLLDIIRLHRHRWGNTSRELQMGGCSVRACRRWRGR